MRRRVASTALFCLLASLAVAGSPAPTSAQRLQERSCVNTTDGGETCVSVSTQCDQNALDTTRAGIVMVWITTTSGQPVDVTANVAQLAPRLLSLTPNQSGFIRVTGRADASHEVAVQLSGPGIPGGSVDIAPLMATSWCGPAPTLVSCVGNDTTVDVTFDNTAGTIAIDVALEPPGDQSNTPIGVVAAGTVTTFTLEPEDPFDFWYRMTAVNNPDGRRDQRNQRTCSFEDPDCAVTSPSIPVDECNALLDIMVGLGWDRGSLRGNLCTSGNCRDGHIVELRFVEACARDRCAEIPERTLSPSIGSLPYLERIKILYAGVHDVGVTGPIPAELGQLSNLESLVLQADFDGQIPPELGQLQSLVELNLRGNDLSGQIPDSLASLPAIRSVTLGDNQLDGPIPAGLGDLPRLRLLDLGRNHLTGQIPANLIRDGLEELRLSANLFDSLPVDVADSPTDLRLLLASDNQLAGPVPAWLADLDAERIDLSGNALSGPLPRNIGNLSTQHLDLSNNAISGTIPDSISDVTWERPSHYDRPRLDLSDNQLTGTIPRGIASPGLVELVLARNDLSGSIPALIAGSDIDTLDLETNRITGRLHEDLFDLTRNSGLMSVNVSDNQLTGELPQTPPMQKFFVADNMLTGTIPGEFGPAMELDLSRNNLSGTIPARLFNIADFAGFVSIVLVARLGGNDFEGPLPTTMNSTAPQAVGDVTLLPNGCLTTEPSTAAVLPRFGVDPSRLCESSDVQQLCRDQFVTVDMALGQKPTAGADVILGTPGNDVIAAGDGDDLVCGGGGDDTIWGQGGNDEIHGDDGHDRIRGGAGDDLLFGHDGRDDINGGTGNDEVWGQDDSDTLRGGSGDDLVHGGAGSDWLVAGNGGVDRVFGGDGNDAVNGGPRGDTISGGAGDDYINGNGGADTITGNSGNDFIRGGPQSDTVDGGDGNDECNGGTNNPVVPDQTIRCETEINIP